MGKIVEKRKKKKGRPSLLDIQKRTIREQQQQQQNQNLPQTIPNSNPNFNPNSDSNRRFTRQNPQLDEITDLPDRILAGEDDEFDEDAKQTEKKFKFVLRVPSQNQNSPISLNSQVFTNNDGENSENLLKKRKINAVEARSGIENGEKEEKHNFPARPTDSASGTAMESGSSTPLPNKKLLVFILDRLQKKDTYGVYSEPVDPKELPDYHEIVEHPMDFGTVRKKVASGAYANLEEFENDVYLICLNAMKYNAPDTIYFRQARSIQELAKKDFENLRQESDDNESQPKVARRGRPPTKNLKKRLGRPPIDRTGYELSSDATLANAGDNNLGSYDLRRGPLSGKSGPADAFGRNYQGSRNGEAFACSAENDEFSGSMMNGVSMRFGKKHFILDGNRRNTYNQYLPLSGERSQSVLSTFDGQKKQLMAVGLHTEHGFARSLARFAATLGPIAWKIASRKIERSLPSGIKFGPGWVGENDTQSSPSLRPPADLLPQQPFPPKLSSSSTGQTTLDAKVELSESQEPSNNSASNFRVNRTSSPSVVTSSSSAGNILNEPSTEHGETSGGHKSESEVGLLSGKNAGNRLNPPPFQIHQGSVLNPSMNGIIGGSQSPASQMDKIGRRVIADEDAPSTAPIHSDMHETVTRRKSSIVESEDTELSGNSNTINSDTPLVNSVSEAQVGGGMGFRQESSEDQKSDSVPPDLSVRFLRSSGSPAASTPQPDLVLQL